MTSIENMAAKNNSSSFANLKGQLLLAMPHMTDPRFHRAVIFICVHDEKGAMGIVLNKTLPSPNFAGVLNQVGVAVGENMPQSLRTMAVRDGGPVQNMNGFLLHSSDFSQKDTIHVDELYGFSGTVETLRAVASGYRPEHMLLTLGYCGWGAGQLEREFHDNVWLTAPASYEIVFRSPADQMWDNAFALIGVNPVMMSGLSGRA